MLLICLLVALSPLLCLGLCIYCCFCSSGSSSQFINLIPREASQVDTANAGGDCSICFMSINSGELVYVLPCSPKHVFHRDCIRHWAKVKNTCPICRAEIPMTDHEPVEGNAGSNQGFRAINANSARQSNPQVIRGEGVRIGGEENEVSAREHWGAVESGEGGPEKAIDGG